MSPYRPGLARETTPERALRRMTERVRRQAAKAAKGEHERIVAREPLADVLADDDDSARGAAREPAPH